MHDFMRIAHRGLAGLYPENTRISFEKSLALCPDAIELDVQLTKDGIPVIHHDEEFGRTVSASGFLKDYTLSEMKKLNASFLRSDLPRQEILTLEEYFDLIRDCDVCTLIELKNSLVLYPGLEEKVLASVDRYERRGTVMVYSANHYSVMRFREMANDVEVIFPFDNWLYDYGEYCQKRNVTRSIPCHLAMTKDVIEDFHRHGVRVYPWTVDTEEEMERIIGLGADGVLTNRMDLLNQCIGGLENGN